MKRYLKKQSKQLKKNLKAIRRFLSEYDNSEIRFCGKCGEESERLLGLVLVQKDAGMQAKLEEMFPERSDYLERNYSKLAEYNRAGWRLGINLIVTTEDKGNPFNSKKAKDMINLYILSFGKSA